MDRAAQIELEWRKAQKAACQRSCRRSNLPLGRAEPNDSDTWTTPEPTFDALDEIFDFDLDPCCYAETATCPNFYTLLEDGLKCPWFGNVFCNPPFSRGNIPLWAAKAEFECITRSVIVVMPVRHAADTPWWKNHVARENVDILYPSGRVRFGGVKKSPPFVSPVLIFWPPWLLDETTVPLLSWHSGRKKLISAFRIGPKTGSNSGLSTPLKVPSLFVEQVARLPRQHQKHNEHHSHIRKTNPTYPIERSP